jgi:putative peptidoglycan binding protein/HlyD family secretion protein
VVIGAGWAWSTGVIPGLHSGANAVAGSSVAGSPSPAASGQAKTVAVERRTMQLAEDLDGTLGYDGTQQVLGGLSGILTWLPAQGAVITRGHALYEVDGGRRAHLMYGNRPAWRPLGPGVQDGRDIRQLEQNLRALHMTSKKLRVDNHWDGRTTAAVKRWQRATGQDDDGTIDPGDIVFLPSALRVTDRPVGLGSPVGPGAQVLQGTTTAKVVTVHLAADRQDLLAAGAAVTVELPDGTTTAGHVARVGRVATASQDQGQGGSTPTIDVTITLDDPSAAGTLDQAPVTVHVVTEAHDQVLAVPVNALVALLEGGYAVEVVAADGSRHYVGVRLGLFQDGLVEVSGQGLNAGDQVLVPS